MKLLLCNMPWGKVDFPSIQLSLLKGHLARHGIKADISYQNMEFSSLIGIERYSKLCGSSRFSFLLEWLFNEFLIRDPQTLKDLRASQEKDIRKLINSRNINPFITEQYEPVPMSDLQLMNARAIDDGLVEICQEIKNTIIPNFFFKLVNGINFADYDIIGFTCSFSQTTPSLSFARIIKEKYPDKVIVLGGNAVSGEMGLEYMRVFPWIDYIVYGEGEHVLVKLVQHLRENGYMLPKDHAVKGIIYRGENGEIKKAPAEALMDMNETALPDYDDYFKAIKAIEKTSGVRLKQDTLLFETARGCWWAEKVQCKFCSLNGENLHFRSKRWEQVLEDLLALSERYERNEFVAIDNILSYPAVDNLLAELHEKNINLEFFWEVKPNLTSGQLKALARAGVKKVQAGLESFSTAVLKLMDKGSTQIGNVRFLKDCYAAGIHVSYNFLFGFPMEKPEFYYDLLDVFPMFHHLTPPLYPPKPMVLQRFSRYFAQLEQHQIENIKPMQQYAIIYPLENIDIEKIAITFSFECSALPADLDYPAHITDAIKEWNINFGGQNRPVLLYEVGVDYVKIYDSRFGQFKSFILKDLAALIYLHCEEVKSLQNIIERVKLKSDIADERIMDILDELLSRKLMMREEDRFLSLAVNIRDVMDRVPKGVMNNILETRLYNTFERLLE